MILGLIFALQWYYATRNRRLVAPDYPESEVRRRRIHGLIIPFISLAGILIAMTGSDNSTMIYMTSPLVSYVADYFSKRTPEKQPEH